MNRNTSGFTLIEILVATIILSVGVFGVYKIIAMNMASLAMHSRYETMLTLETPLRECLRVSSGSFVTKATGYDFYVSFGPDLLGCEITASETGVTINETTFYMTGKIISKIPNTLVEYSITEPNYFWHLPQGPQQIMLP